MFSQSETEILLSTTEILPQGFTQIFTGTRDGTKYPLVASSDRFWLNANLNFETPDSDCLNDKEENCKSLERLYSWEEAQNVCPVNWKLPDREDFRRLFELKEDLLQNMEASISEYMNPFKQWA